MASSQLNVADADFSPRSNRLQCCKDDLLLLEALHSIGGARVIDEGSCGEQPYTCIA